MKEYLSFVNGKIEYYQANNRKDGKDVLIPKGATQAFNLISSDDFMFWKHDNFLWSTKSQTWVSCLTGYYTYSEKRDELGSGYLNHFWQRPTETLTKDERVIWFEKFIGGERVQYRVKDTQQWHNMTFKSLVIFDHKDLEFRNAPTVVEIDGFNFHSKESLLKYIDNNYQLD